MMLPVRSHARDGITLVEFSTWEALCLNWGALCLLLLSTVSDVFLKKLLLMSAEI
jgi:hypothetical protein